MSDAKVTLYHGPNTRSTGVLTLLEELGAPYDLHVLDRGKGEHLTDAYRAINPMMKVPALRDLAGNIIIEQVAILLYLADLFPAAGITPAIGDPLRGPYLRWMIFYAASFEPALTDKFRKVEPGHQGMSPYGSYDRVIESVITALSKGDYILGDTFTAADVLWGTALHWTVGFKLVPAEPVITAYVERIMARPAVKRASARDRELAAGQKT